jgi:hypothetical protein
MGIPSLGLDSGYLLILEGFARSRLAREQWRAICEKNIQNSSHIFRISQSFFLEKKSPEEIAASQIGKYDISSGAGALLRDQRQARVFGFFVRACGCKSLPCFQSTSCKIFVNKKAPSRISLTSKKKLEGGWAAMQPMNGGG